MRYCAGPQKTVLHIVREDGGRAADQPYATPSRPRALCSGTFAPTEYDPEVRICAKCEALRQVWVADAEVVLATYGLDHP